MAGDYASSVKFVSLLTGENPTVTVSYGISGGPTCIAFMDGLEIGRQVGFVADPEEGHLYLLNALQPYLGTPDVARTVQVKIDTVAPTTVATGADDLWHAAPVRVGFAATDNVGGSGVASTEYSLEGGAWTPGASVTVPAPPATRTTHTILYRSSDYAVNLEADKTCLVMIDTTTLAAPTIARLRPVAARRRAVVTITGAGFGATRSTSAVTFGSRRCAAYLSWSDTRIKCRVPAKAQCGEVKVTVTTAAGASAGRHFRVKR